MAQIRSVKGTILKFPTWRGIALFYHLLNSITGMKFFLFHLCGARLWYITRLHMKRNYTPQTSSCTENFSLPKVRIFMLTKEKNLILILKVDQIKYNYFFGKLKFYITSGSLGSQEPLVNINYLNFPVKYM